MIHLSFVFADLQAAATTASTTVVDATHYVHFHEVELIRSQSYYFRIFIAGNPITKSMSPSLSLSFSPTL
jgi:hypothetical protein